MREAVIVAALRTPIGRRGGALSGVHPVELSAAVLTALADRAGIDPALVDDVVWGCVSQLDDQGGNVGRMAVLAAGWPDSVPGSTVNRACGSGQEAVHVAVGAVMAGIADVVVAGGVESMSRVPLGAARANGDPWGPSVVARYGADPFSQGLAAEAVARRWRLTRAELDAFAVQSHRRAVAAADSGAVAGQVVGVGSVTADEGMRRDTSVEKLAALPAAFQDGGSIHAGNSSQISDGAAGLLIVGSDVAAERNLRPIARFHSGSVAAADPVEMLTAPIPATAKVLKRAGLSVADIGAFEVNEAFASVPLAWLAETGADPGLVNPLGGAIALGHPLGASGAILMTRLVHHMRDTGTRYGLQTMCEAGGMANATILELLGT